MSTTLTTSHRWLVAGTSAGTVSLRRQATPRRATDGTLIDLCRRAV